MKTVIAIALLVSAATLLFLHLHDKKSPPWNPITATPGIHPAEGMVLMNPAIKDSLGRSLYMILPPGSTVEIPSAADTLLDAPSHQMTS